MARKKKPPPPPFKIKLKRKDPFDFDCSLECEAIRLEHPVEQPPEKYRQLDGNVYFVIEPPHKYRKFCKDIWAGCFTAGNALMAIAVFAVLTFSATDYAEDLIGHWDKLHVPMCSLGLIFFSGPGITSINKLHGPSAQLTRWGRWIDHILLTIFGISAAVAGTALCFVYIEEEELEWSEHCIFGLVSLGLGFIVMITGIIAAVPWKRNRNRMWTKMFHLFLGLLTFLCYIGCFVTGLLKEIFIEWALENFDRYHYVLMFLIGLYALIVITVPCLKCMRYMGHCKISHVCTCRICRFRMCKPTQAQIDDYLVEEEFNKMYPKRKVDKKKEKAKEKIRRKKEKERLKKEKARLKKEKKEQKQKEKNEKMKLKEMKKVHAMESEKSVTDVIEKTEKELTSTSASSSSTSIS